MKKRILVLLLALVMVAGFALPAAAAQDELVSDEPVVIADDPAPTTEEENASTDESGEAPAPASDEAAATALLDVMPVSDGDAPTQDSVQYVDASGESQTVTDYTVVTSSTTTLSDDWYVVKGDVTIDSAVTVSGNVNLILCDGKTLTVNGSNSHGIKINNNASLTIYGQTGQSGTLTTSSGTELNKHGILIESGGSLTIAGGKVTSNATNGQGINALGTLTVNGGNVTATGVNGLFVQGSATINDGTLNATGKSGIRVSSFNNITAELTIAGGTVIASSNDSTSKAVDLGSNSGAPIGTLTPPATYYWRAADGAKYRTQASYTESALKGEYFELTTTKPSNIEPYVTGAAATVTYGDAVDGSVITATTDVEGTFAWKNVIDYGDASTMAKPFTATFTPNDSSYVPVEVEVSVTVNKKTLTVTANDHSITYGDEAANNGVTYDGFVTGEDESKLTGALDYEYDYSQYNNAGSYTITPKGLTADNYDITFKPGTLTVEPKTIGIDWTDTKLTHNGKAQKPTATATGLVNGDECTITVTGEQTEAGTYTATATGLDNPNYKLPEDVTCEFTIAAKPAEGKKEPPKTEKAPHTGDAGIALYVLSAASSMTGLVWLGRKKKR